MGEAKRRKLAGGSTPTGTDLRDAMVRQAYQNTCYALNAEPGDIVGALISTYQGRNFSLDLVSQGIDKDLVACSNGCSACCHQLVLCNPFEVFIIAQHLLSTKADHQIDDIERKLSEISELALNPEARYGRHAPCPLLVDNCCSIYERRPSPCRALFSNSRVRCERSLKDGAGDIEFLGYPQVLAASMQIGIDAALRRRCGLDVEKVELCGSLLLAIRDFDGALTDWLGGGKPFSAFEVQRSGVPTAAELIDIVSARLSL